jgi:hypothetical protein
MRTTFKDDLFLKEINNIINYSIGFTEGVKRGKNQILSAIGTDAIELLKQYIDASARTNPAMLHHVYEWNQTGSPAGRLYDIDYTVSGVGLSIKSTFRQSTSIKEGSTVPFYNKARIIENGIPVVIKPKNSSVLAFDDNGEQVFTRKPIVVENPGGTEAQGGFNRIFDSFFNNYFTQAFLRSSGVMKYLTNPIAYKKNLSAGKRGGRAVGISTGYAWVANIGGIK